MRVVVQRVINSQVIVDGKTVGKIEKGLLVFLAIHENDELEFIDRMVDKIYKLRIFEDENEKMNLSLENLGLEVLVVSQFTLYGDCKKGNRPSFTESARPEKAIPFYNKFVAGLREKGLKVSTGEFGAKMKVELLNDGPVTLIIDLPVNCDK